MIEVPQAEESELARLSLELYRDYEQMRQKEMGRDGTNYMRRLLVLERWTAHRLAILELAAKRRP